MLLHISISSFFGCQLLLELDLLLFFLIELRFQIRAFSLRLSQLISEINDLVLGDGSQARLFVGLDHGLLIFGFWISQQLVLKPGHEGLVDNAISGERSLETYRSHHLKSSFGRELRWDWLNFRSSFGFVDLLDVLLFHGHI